MTAKWTLRVQNAKSAIRGLCDGASWIIYLVSAGRRDGKMCAYIPWFITILRTSPKALLLRLRQRWANENQ